MKKYLVKGALALFAGAFLFSCAEKESEFVPLAQQKVKAFEEGFKELYGDIDPYQDWGFSSGKVEIDPNDSSLVVEVKDLDDDVAFTRTRAFSGTRAMTRGVIKESHELPEGLSMPTLKEGEAEAVMEWFQVNDGENSVGLDISDFFIVYVGGNQTVNIHKHEWDGNYYNNNKDKGATSNFWDEYLENQSVVLDYLHINGEHMNDWNANYGPTLYVHDSQADYFLARNSYITSSDATTTTTWKLAAIEYDGEVGYYVGISAYAKKLIGTYETLPESGVYEDRADYTDYDREEYYDDWVFKIVPANGVTPEPEPDPEPEITYEYPEESIDEWTQKESGRVFCEDLGNFSREDLDYNDVVFDAIIFENHKKYTQWRETYIDGVRDDSQTIVWRGPTEETKYYANVEILAAGGTIPVTVEDLQVHDQFEPVADVATMINTRDNNSTAYGSYDTRHSVQLSKGIVKNFTATVDGEEKTFNLRLFEIEKPIDSQFIKSIKIVSSFNGQQVSEVTGEKGGAPQKFMAPIGTQWTSERKNISLAYPLFDAWVKGGTAPWGTVNPDYLYSGATSSTSIQLPLVMKARRTRVLEGEVALWTGSQSYGSNWNLANLPATLNVDKFYPGDRLRFYGENIGVVNDPDVVDKTAWITVVIGSITPYFIDTSFPNYVENADGTTTAVTTGCIEVLLDEDSAKLLNAQISGGKVTFQVQGRNFTLTRICKVLFQ